MTERQKEHQGRSASGDKILEGRDIRSGAVAGTAHEQLNKGFEEGAESSAAALHIQELLDKAKQHDSDEASER